MTTRRTVLAGLAATATLSSAPARARGWRPALIAGTYAAKGGAGLYRLPAAGRGWRVGAADPALRDASFGVSRGSMRYLVRESAGGRMIATDRDGKILVDLPSGGDDPCHVAIDPAGRLLAVANYSSGTVAIYPLAAGIPQPPVVRQHRGTGPRADRQGGPHAHWVGFTPDNRFLHSVDLGADAIFAYPLASGEIGEPMVAWRAPAGAGPRHLAYHPALPVAYCVTELANTLVTLDAQFDGTLTSRATTSLLPAGWQGRSQAAHIAIDRAGRRLYASNRGHDSIAMFDLAEDGSATLAGHVPCGGDWPRFFLLLEDTGQLLVANERSGEVAVFALTRDGALRPTPVRLAVPGVVFLDRA
ncbi:lactonase family protein [Sphingomonas hankookensis]|uniref:6-phosphogluconolactonase n=1 Tax=Sphingomonas hengshuiensis TaxID=1609977 RepID=A0A2W4ZGP8_9SPHN|nr:MAG: 6-phosphogluconolactonase [Sphingomonas hengshuiensis]